MKKAEVTKLRDKKVEELLKEAEKLRAQMTETAVAMHAKTVKDTNTMMKLRKQLAVIMTVLTQKKEQK